MKRQRVAETFGELYILYSSEMILTFLVSRALSTLSPSACLFISVCLPVSISVCLFLIFWAVVSICLWLSVYSVSVFLSPGPAITVTDWALKIKFSHFLSLCVRVCVCVCVRVRACVRVRTCACVCVHAHLIELYARCMPVEP